MSRVSIAVGMVLLAGIAACGPKIKVRLNEGGSRPARPESCDAVVYREADDVPAGYTEIGMIHLDEAGATVNCAPAQMLAELRRQTCLAGADAARVTSVRQADMESTCFRINAKLLVREAAR